MDLIYIQWIIPFIPKIIQWINLSLICIYRIIYYPSWCYTYPSEKWWSSSQLGWFSIPNWMESHNPFMFQSTNQYPTFYGVYILSLGDLWVGFLASGMEYYWVFLWMMKFGLYIGLHIHIENHTGKVLKYLPCGAQLTTKTHQLTKLDNSGGGKPILSQV